MNTSTKEKMDLWLSMHPESTHPLDEERKFKFVRSLYENEDSGTFEDLFNSFRNSHPDYNEQYCRELCEDWELEIGKLKRFTQFIMRYS